MQLNSDIFAGWTLKTIVYVCCMFDCLLLCRISKKNNQTYWKIRSQSLYVSFMMTTRVHLQSLYFLLVIYQKKLKLKIHSQSFYPYHFPHQPSELWGLEANTKHFLSSFVQQLMFWILDPPSIFGFVLLVSSFELWSPVNCLPAWFGPLPVLWLCLLFIAAWSFVAWTVS